MSRNSGRPVMNPKSASSSTASVPIVFAASSRSKAVGPSSARATASAERDQHGDDGDGEHQACAASNHATLRFISSSAKPSALSRSMACTQSARPRSVASTVSVPGVSVIEFA